LGTEKFEKRYIYVPCDCVELPVYLGLIIGVSFSVLILFLELGCLAVRLFFIFF